MRWSPGCNCCADCIEAPTRAACEYRSGTNGESVAARPNVGVSITTTGTTPPACGGCSFSEGFSWVCNSSVSSEVENCTFSSTYGGSACTVRRTLIFLVTPKGTGGGVGFFVSIVENYLIISGAGTGLGYNGRNVLYTYEWDDFDYTDCDTNPQTDTNGALEFTLVSTSDPGEFYPGVPFTNYPRCTFTYTISAVNET